MRRLLTAGAFAALIAGCANTGTSQNNNDADTARLGIETANFDRSVRPQDDFYRFVNGGWLASTPIPDDKSNYGSFSQLADQAREQLRVIIEEAAATPSRTGTDTQKVGDVYRSFMDTDAIERAGLTPLNDEVARIDAIETPADLLNYFGHAQSSGGGSTTMWSRSRSIPAATAAGRPCC